MKYNYFFIAGLIMLCGSNHGFAVMHGNFYAAGLVADNIGSIQHSIIQNAINDFSGLKHNKTVQHKTHNNVNTHIYGSMPMYGEFGDDVIGRSGGDFADLHNVWLNWQYDNAYVKFNQMDKVDIRQNIAMVGFAEDTRYMGKLGAIAGYVGTTHHGSDLDLIENGGFFGVYDGWCFGNLKLDAVIDGGVISVIDNNYAGANNFSNLWIGTGVNAAYDWRVDDTFVVQPLVFVGYTWIDNPDYNTNYAVKIDNQNVNTLELSPGLRFIKNVIGDWFGVAGVKYVANFNGGGKVVVDGYNIDTLSRGNYMEYGIGIERHIADFDLSININRRDGGYTGWFGSLNVKYTF